MYLIYDDILMIYFISVHKNTHSFIFIVVKYT